MVTRNSYMTNTVVEHYTYILASDDIGSRSLLIFSQNYVCPKAIRYPYFIVPAVDVVSQAFNITAVTS